jgi:phosphoglycolate phosphatase-like HAD superfamily hydrolase
MHLVMFDLDGTLTETSGLDTACFVRAAADALDIHEVDPDWDHYPHATDPGCFEQLVRVARGREPTPAETRRFRRRHFDLLREGARRDPASCRAVRGAADMLRQLAARPDVTLALATGAWSRSARIKLAAAGVTLPAIAMATGDDAVARVDIMAAAERRAARKARAKRFATRTYIGDAAWDVRASAAMEYRFIGVGRGSNAAALRRAGAHHVVSDYALGRFMATLLRVWNGDRPSPSPAAPPHPFG